MSNKKPLEIQGFFLEILEVEGFEPSSSNRSLLFLHA